MKALPRWRRPAWLAGRAALTLGLAGAALTLGLAGTAMPQGLAGTAMAGSQGVGAHGTLSVVTAHTAVAWGEGSCGELGNGSTSPSSRWVGVIGLNSPVVQVAAGDCHSLAVLSDGRVWAWGINNDGQLGIGPVAGGPVPAEVITLTGDTQAALTGITQVAAGQDFSLALRSDGTVWAWGNNDHGQLGTGAIGGYQLWAVQVPGLTGVTKIAAGTNFSLALRSDGTVWAWGNNGSGELGIGTRTDSPVPVQVLGLSGVTNISAGYDACLATRVSGILGRTSVWTWGGNGHGELGDGTFTDHLVPEFVNGIGIPFGGSVAGISAGDYYSLVLGTDGSVWAWGDNFGGKLGSVATGEFVTVPVQEIGTGSGFTQVSAGGQFTLALRSDGTAWAWGDNYFGELGDGTTTFSSAPVQVAGLTNVTQVAAGWEFALAVHTVPLQILP